MNRKKLIVLVGPTAVGKTAIAIRLAEEFKTEVVSADSRQVFREMNIGTAKPTVDELSRIHHHFVNTRSIAENYDAGMYSREVHEVLDRLFLTKEVIILCGGSGLYIKAVLEGFDDMPDIPQDIREEITIRYKQGGLPWLQDIVRQEDPDYYEIVDRQNPQRLMRALEVIQHTGKPFSSYHQKQQRALPFDVVKIGLTLDRKILYERIDARMDKMIADGLFEEAESLFSKRHHPALQTVGYQEIFGFLEGNYDRNEAERLLKRNSRRYAKRQLTWFQRDKAIQWVSPDDWNGILQACSSNVVPT